MYKLIVKNKGVTIIDKTLSKGDNYFTISIREEDLIKLREDKLSDLFK